jgi:hypothetical protein
VSKRPPHSQERELKKRVCVGGDFPVNLPEWLFFMSERLVSAIYSSAGRPRVLQSRDMPPGSTEISERPSFKGLRIIDFPGWNNEAESWLTETGDYLRTQWRNSV